MIGGTNASPREPVGAESLRGWVQGEDEDEEEEEANEKS